MNNNVIIVNILNNKVHHLIILSLITLCLQVKEEVKEEDKEEKVEEGEKEKGEGDSKETEEVEKKESKATNLRKKLSFKKSFSFLRKKAAREKKEGDDVEATPEKKEGEDIKEEATKEESKEEVKTEEKEAEAAPEVPAEAPPGRESSEEFILFIDISSLSTVSLCIVFNIPFSSSLSLLQL